MQSVSLCKCSSYTEQTAVSLRPQINISCMFMFYKTFKAVILSKLRHLTTDNVCFYSFIPQIIFVFIIYSVLCVFQWWSVTKYNYFVTVLKYIFQVSVLYWSSFILSNFYFYFTTFQSIRSYFLLHYIS